MYNLISVLSIFSKLQEWSDKFKSWIMDNYSNPILWVGILGGGFLFYKIMYGALNKD